MADRVLWTCPGCRKRYNIPRGPSPDFCPACSAPAFEPPRRKTGVLVVNSLMLAATLLWAVSLMAAFVLEMHSASNAVIDPDLKAPAALFGTCIAWFFLTFGYGVVMAILLTVRMTVRGR